MSKFTKQSIKSNLSTHQFEWLKRIYLSFFRIYNQLSTFILGKHPKNTIFSFNFHNVNHINKFFNEVTKNLSSSNYTVVDVGSGRCPYYDYFSEKITKYIAIDTAESLPQNDDVRLIEKIQGYAENLPVNDCIADIVICNQVLEHVLDPIKTVSEVNRVLKPGGLFIGSVPHIDLIHLEPYDFRRYTNYGIKKLLEDHGFQDVRVDGNGGIYSAVALIIAMNWVLTSRVDGRSQGFSLSTALLLSPIIGLMNFLGKSLDTFFSDKQRSPTNLCWIATKPIRKEN